ncbi:MAG: hypothetical protein WC071_11290 [Victivallaceae bacterium]
MNFRDYFKYNGEDYAPSYLLFLNESSGNYELVARSGHIICIIPHVSFLSDKEHLKLARAIFVDLQHAGRTSDTDSHLDFINVLNCSIEIDSIIDSVDFEFPWVDYSRMKPIHYSPAS